MCDIASVDIGGTGLFDYARVDEAISRIVDATDPRMIVVFGSVSRHEAEDGSDLDLLVVFDEVESERDLYATIARQFVGLGLPFDLVVMSYADFLRYKDNGYSFTHEILTTGKVVYSIGNRDGIGPVRAGGVPSKVSIMHIPVETRFEKSDFPLTRPVIRPINTSWYTVLKPYTMSFHHGL